MNFKEFLEKQESIYDKFRTSNLGIDGTKPSLPSHSGGYLVVLRHRPEIAEQIQKMSDSASKIVPSITYHSTEAHTTITDTIVQNDFSPDIITLKDLSKAVLKLLNSKTAFQEISIAYSSWLSNQNTLIAQGMPNEAFFNAVKEISSYEDSFRMPWGAHSTIARYAKEMSADQIQGLFALLERTPALGESKPIAVDTGHYFINKGKPEFTTFKRHEIL